MNYVTHPPTSSGLTAQSIFEILKAKIDNAILVFLQKHHNNELEAYGDNSAQAVSDAISGKFELHPAILRAETVLAEDDLKELRGKGITSDAMVNFNFAVQDAVHLKLLVGIILKSARSVRQGGATLETAVG